METKDNNFLKHLKEQNFSAEQNKMAISLAMIPIDTLYRFFLAQAVCLAKIRGIEEPTNEQLAEKMAAAVDTAAEHLEDAARAYGDFLEKGPISVFIGMLAAGAMMGMMPDKKQEMPDISFEITNKVAS